MSGSISPVRRRGPCAGRGAHRRAWPVSSSSGVRLAAQRAVAGRGQPRRHLVERSGGDDQDAEDAEEQQHRHHDVRRAEQVEEEGGDDVADRAAALAQRAGVAGDRLRVALGDVHDAEQPQAERAPADDLAAGRAVADRVAQVAPADDEQHRAAPASRPCRREPVTATRTAPMTGPPSWNHTAAAVMTDSAKTKRPTPSRRCSGSRSRAPWPIPRATAPMPWATASQTAATPRKTVSKKRAIGPLPVRTARGAGRRLRLAGPLPPLPPARGRLPRRLLLARRGSALVSGTPGSRASRRRAPASRTRRGRRTGRHATTLGIRHTSHRDPTGACRRSLPRPPPAAETGRFPLSPHQPHPSHGLSDDAPKFSCSKGLRGVVRCLGCAQVIGRLRGCSSTDGRAPTRRKISPRRQTLVKFLKQGICLALLGAGLAAAPATLAVRRPAAPPPRPHARTTPLRDQADGSGSVTGRRRRDRQVELRPRHAPTPTCCPRRRRLARPRRPPRPTRS